VTFPILFCEIECKIQLKWLIVGGKAGIMDRRRRVCELSAPLSDMTSHDSALILILLRHFGIESLYGPLKMPWTVFVPGSVDCLSFTHFIRRLPSVDQRDQSAATRSSARAVSLRLCANPIRCAELSEMQIVKIARWWPDSQYSDVKVKIDIINTYKLYTKLNDKQPPSGNDPDENCIPLS
jgi:hypothetical protein